MFLVGSITSLDYQPLSRKMSPRSSPKLTGGSKTGLEKMVEIEPMFLEELQGTQRLLSKKSEVPSSQKLSEKQSYIRQKLDAS